MPKFLSQIDASKIPIKGLVAETGSTAPATPANGQLWYDTATHKLKAYQNGAWVTLDLDTNTTYAAGTAALISTGTDTTQRVWTAKEIHDGVDLVAPVKTVAGRTGDVVLAKADVGLANVDNTTDLNKPISTATQTALNGKANTGHTHTASEITDFNAAADARVTAGLADYATTTAVNAAVQSAIQGHSNKQSVRAATTGNITLSGAQTIDGVSVSDADRVLVKNQTNASQNGIYRVGASGWTRAVDADVATELRSAYVWVSEGTTQQDTGWLMTTDNITLGTTALTWTQVSGAGQIDAGDGLAKAGNVLSVNVGAGLEIVSDAVRIADSGVTSSKILDGAVGPTKLANNAVDLTGTKVTGTLPVTRGGTGATTAAGARNALGAAGVFSGLSPALTAGSFANVTHNLNNAAPQVSFIEAASGEAVVLDWKTVDANTIAIRADLALSASALTIAVQG